MTQTLTKSMMSTKKRTVVLGFVLGVALLLPGSLAASERDALEFFADSCTDDVTSEFDTVRCAFSCLEDERIEVSGSGIFVQVNASCGGASASCTGSSPAGVNCSGDSATLVSSDDDGVCTITGTAGATGTCSSS